MTSDILKDLFNKFTAREMLPFCHRYPEAPRNVPDVQEAVNYAEILLRRKR